PIYPPGKREFLLILFAADITRESQTDQYHRGQQRDGCGGADAERDEQRCEADGNTFEVDRGFDHLASRTPAGTTWLKSAGSTLWPGLRRARAGWWCAAAVSSKAAAHWAHAQQDFARSRPADILMMLAALHKLISQRFLGPFRCFGQVSAGCDDRPARVENTYPRDRLRRIANDLVDGTLIIRRFVSCVSQQAIDARNFAIRFVLGFLPDQAARNVPVSADGLNQQQQS